MPKTTDYSAGMQSMARMLLWSIRYQDQVAHYIRLYVFGTAMFILFLGFCQIISFDAALEIILIGGMTFCIGLGLFIVKRRSWLLHITDKDLKREAYATMLAYITAKEISTGQKRSAFTGDCRNKDCTF